MPPIKYNVKRRHFEEATGKRVTRSQVRGLIDKLVAVTKADAGRIGSAYNAGKITSKVFETRMRDVLKSGHIIAAAVGRGGTARMNEEAWSIVGEKLKSEYTFLANLTRKLDSGKIVRAYSAGRAQKYAASITVSFYKSFGEANKENRKSKVLVRRILNAAESCEGCIEYAAMDWISVDAMPEIGELDCGNFCKCDLEFSDD